MIDVGAKSVYFACDECGICKRQFGENFQFDHCSCDKIDAEFFAGGYCEDAFEMKAQMKNKGKRKTGRAFRRKMKRKAIKRYRDGNNWISGPYLCERREGDKLILGSYVKYPQNSSSKVFLKRVSNKKVRQSEDIPLKGNGYRRVLDYWWTID